MAFALRHEPTGVFVGIDEDYDDVTDAEQFETRKLAEDAAQNLVSPAHEFSVVEVPAKDSGISIRASRGQSSEKFLPSEALYVFAAWLTCREKPVTPSRKHEAGIAAVLVDEFCIANSLEDPREDHSLWPKHPGDER